jgi:SAM-dependent methyltransferase
MQSVRFDRAVGYYDATRGFAPGTAERIQRAIAAQTGATPTSRFLELGVGTGRVALPFLAAGYRYVGVDLSRPMLRELCAKLPSDAPLPALVEGDVTRLPLADGWADVVLGVHVLHLVGDWRATLVEARRVLRRPGGQLLLAEEMGGDEQEGDAPPPAQARRRWRVILEALGYPEELGRPGIRADDPAVRAELEALGALVEELDLTEYERRPISARMVAQRFRDRIYSADWARPDAIHNAALERLEQWLATDCPEPDQPYALRGRLRVMLARWGEAGAAGV